MDGCGPRSRLREREPTNKLCGWKTTSKKGPDYVCDKSAPRRQESDRGNGTVAASRSESCRSSDDRYQLESHLAGYVTDPGAVGSARDGLARRTGRDAQLIRSFGRG